MLALLSLFAQATSLATLDLAQLTDAADTIARGTVAEVWTELDEGGRVWTHAQVEVNSVFKGEDTALLVVSQPGGMWGDRMTHVIGSARFSVGEDIYLFADHLDSGRTVLVGMFQGKLNTQMDPTSQRRIVLCFPVSAGTPFDHRFIPLPPVDERVSVAAFEAELIEQVANGWDGRPVPGVSEARLERSNR